MALNIYVGVCRVCRETANGTILSRCTLSGYLVWGGGGGSVCGMVQSNKSGSCCQSVTCHDLSSITW